MPNTFRIRPWERADAPVVIGAYTDVATATQARYAPLGEEAALEWIDDWTHTADIDHAYAFAVVDEVGAVVGHVELSDIDRQHETAWVAYWTVAAARRRGAATAGARLAARYAFDKLGLFRLELGHRVNNPASCQVATRAGFRPEGLERQKLRYGTRRYDVETHARLATDP